MHGGGRILIAVALATLVPYGGAAARPGHHHRHTVQRAVPPPPVPPSQDAVELAILAPPSRRSTLEQSYGDAAYARGRLERRIDREVRDDFETVATIGGAPYPCEPRIAGASAYVCNGAPHPRSYGQGYSFTPAYLAAPQRRGALPNEQTPVLPPLTGLAWVVNSLRPDPHN